MKMKLQKYQHKNKDHRQLNQQQMLFKQLKLKVLNKILKLKNLNKKYKKKISKKNQTSYLQ